MTMFMKNRKKIAVGLGLFFAFFVFSPGLFGFDPDQVLRDGKLKKELQKIDSDKKSEGVFMRMAKGILQLKGHVDFCEELWEGAFSKQIEAIMDVPESRWNMAGWGFSEIQNVKRIVSKNKKMPLIRELKVHGAELATFMSLYSIAQDIKAGIEGDDGKKLEAVIKSFEFAQGYIMNKLGIGISNVASAGASIIKFSLDQFIKEAQFQYEGYWWNAYMQYLEGRHKGIKTWIDLANTSGEAGIQQRLYEFWDNPYDNAARFYGKARIQTAPALADRTMRDQFAAYYYKKFIYPSLKSYYQREAEKEEARKFRMAQQKHARLMELKADISLLMRAIAAAEKLKEAKGLSISPASKDAIVGDTVTFTLQVDKGEGKVETVASSQATWDGATAGVFSATREGTFTVTATYGELSASATVSVAEEEEEEEDKPEKVCPEKEHYDRDIKDCVCNEGLIRSTKDKKCKTIDEINEELKEEEEEDPCDKDIKELFNRLDILKSQADASYTKFCILASKFFQQINTKVSNPCNDGIVAYCYSSALGESDNLGSIVENLTSLASDIILDIAICDASEEYDMGSVLSDISGIKAQYNKTRSSVASMQGKLKEMACDENEVRQQGEHITSQGGMDPDFLQDGGSMSEVPGDGTDQDADGLQDEGSAELAGYNTVITVFDSGNAKDDVFAVSLSGRGPLGTTPKGARRSFGANLDPGQTYTVTLTVISSEEGPGTFTILVFYKGKRVGFTSENIPVGSSSGLTFRTE